MNLIKKWVPLLIMGAMIFAIAGCGGGGTGTPPVNAGTLLITEVGSMANSDASCWLEIYNNSSDSVQLSNFKLRTRAILTTDFTTVQSSVTFSLPSLVIAPGAYAIVRGKPYDFLQSGGNVVYIKDSTSNYCPYWEDGGFVELLQNNQTIDFVRFGSDLTSPTTSSAWSGGDAPAFPFVRYGMSIARNGANADTDVSSDWTLHNFATPGGPNDVTADDDTDQDGIPDCSEQSGSTFAGLPLYSWGARVGQKDIFIHVDYMNSGDPGVVPQRAALDKVKAAFAARGYTLHFDVGNLYTSGGNDPANYNLDGRSHQVPFANGVSFPFATSDTAVVSVYNYKNAYMPLAKRQIFHYLLMGYTQQSDGSDGSSGIAELPGNDFIVTLGNWGLTANTQKNLNMLINFQAGTIMHEFGHNLGLHHGGNVDTNYKPNYYSIMNYNYQLYGLPTIGNHEGDRYYLIRDYTSYVPLGMDSLIKGPYASDMVIDYSNGLGGSINENSVVEANGLCRLGSTGIDFNNNGLANETLVYNVNGDSSYSTLTDYNDWANLNLFFARDYFGDFTGTSKDRIRVWRDPVGNDRQQVIVETLTRAKVFRK